METTRFAPSPTGHLHLGHAYAALFAYRHAHGGKFIVRIEDIDAARCREEFARAILEDLSWLGLAPSSEVRYQSAHMEDYRHALAKLDALDVLYPCFCTRAEIAREIARAQSAPHGPDGALYPGTCRTLSSRERESRMTEGHPYAIRLDTERAFALTGPLHFMDRKRGRTYIEPRSLGDVVLARKDTPTSYHLSVTLDDHLQAVTLVTRGEDLFHATHIHRLLQSLLGLSVPEYLHHPLMLGDDGLRLSKRDRSLTLRALREAGVTPEEVRRRTGLWP